MDRVRPSSCILLGKLRYGSGSCILLGKQRYGSVMTWFLYANGKAEVPIGYGLVPVCQWESSGTDKPLMPGNSVYRGVCTVVKKPQDLDGI